MTRAKNPSKPSSSKNSNIHESSSSKHKQSSSSSSSSSSHKVNDSRQEEYKLKMESLSLGRKNLKTIPFNAKQRELTKKRKHEQREATFKKLDKIDIRAETYLLAKEGESPIYNKTRLKALIKYVATLCNGGVTPTISDDFVVAICCILRGNTLIPGILADAAQRKMDFVDFENKPKEDRLKARCDVRLIGRCTKSAAIHHFDQLDTHMGTSSSKHFELLYSAFRKRFDEDKKQKAIVRTAKNLMKSIPLLLDNIANDALEMEEETTDKKRRSISEKEKAHRAKLLDRFMNGVTTVDPKTKKVKKTQIGIVDLYSDMRLHFDSVSEYRGKKGEDRSNRWSDLSYVYRFYDALLKKVVLIVTGSVITTQGEQIVKTNEKIQTLTRSSSDSDAPSNKKELDEWLVGSIESSINKSKDKELKEEQRNKSKKTAANRKIELEELVQNKKHFKKKVLEYKEYLEQDEKSLVEADDILHLQNKRWNEIDEGTSAAVSSSSKVLTKINSIKNKASEEKNEESDQEQNSESEKEEEEEQPRKRQKTNHRSESNKPTTRSRKNNEEESNMSD